MQIVLSPGFLAGDLRVPASKSMTHRLLICAALSPGISRLSGVDFSQDIAATMDVLTALGAFFQVDGDTILVQGISERTPPKKVVADCRESGSTLRFLMPVAAALGLTATFEGRGRLPARPIDAYVREMSQKGISFSAQKLPLTISGHLRAGTYTLEGDVSSQYVSGLLFALPLLDGDSQIRLTSPLQSRPYVDMTIDCLKRFGVQVKDVPGGYVIPGGQRYAACDAHVEGDYSQAAFFCVANALGSKIRLTNLSSDSRQGDRQIVSIVENLERLKACGAPVCFSIDAADIPDLVPILAVLGTFCTAPSHIYGAARLRLKESDRLSGIAGLLGALGGHVEAHADGLDIFPVHELQGGVVDSLFDHRLAMCAAIAATRCKHNVTILHAECVEKSYPRFFEDYQKLGGNAHVVTLEP